MRASACVSGRNFATQVSAAGMAVIGKSEPAKNHGTIAIAGRAPTYSSCRDTRLARVSATPYMPTASRPAAARNQATPPALALEVDPAQDGGSDQRRQLQAGDRERDREVAEHEQAPVDRRGEQLPLGAALAVDDDADAREHRVERDQQAHRRDGHERRVVDPAAVGSRRAPP